MTTVLAAWCVPLLLLLPQTLAQGADIPLNDGFVTDGVGILQAEEEQRLEQRLAAYAQQTSNEIAVVIVPTLSGSSIADMAVQIGRTWGVGGAENDNGIVILVAYADRSVFIATGYGLEGVVPDIVAAGIVERDIAPQFRNGAYADGIEAAIDALEKHIGGEYTAERYDEGATGDIPAFVVVFIVIALQIAAPLLGRSKSWWQGGALGGVVGLILAVVYAWWVSIPFLVVCGLLFDYVVSRMKPRRNRRRWGSGGGFGGFGGSSGGGSGGFGGFSGGSFGGGGGGGRW